MAGIVMATSIVLLYPCYNYKFKHFKIFSKLIAITSTLILVFLLASQ